MTNVVEKTQPETGRLCTCHDQPMQRKKDNQCLSGYTWRCSVKNREATSRWRLDHPQRKQAADRAYYQQNPVRRHGITTARYEELLREQGFRCAACEISLEDYPGNRFDVDHDHSHCDVCASKSTSCGLSIRGLLCNPCNVTIAHESSARLSALISYLERTKT